MLEIPAELCPEDGIVHIVVGASVGQSPGPVQTPAGLVLQEHVGTCSKAPKKRPQALAARPKVAIFVSPACGFGTAELLEVARKPSTRLWSPT